VILDAALDHALNVCVVRLRAGAALNIALAKPLSSFIGSLLGTPLPSALFDCHEHELALKHSGVAFSLLTTGWRPQCVEN
jgi:hypothetical protein